MLSEKVKIQLETDRNREMTLQQISDKYHIPQSHIANLLNGKRSYGGISLGTFDRMFPNAKVDLGLPSTPVHRVMQIETTNQAAIGGNFTIHQGVEVDKAFRQKVYDLAIKHSDKKGFVLLAPFLKELQELK